MDLSREETREGRWQDGSGDPILPNPATSPPYSYDETSGFRINDISPASPHDLKTLFDGKKKFGQTKNPLVIEMSYGLSDILLEKVNAIPGLAIYQSKTWAVVGWDTELERGVQLHFDDLADLPTDPGDGGGIMAQATFDFDRFVLKYLHIDIAKNYKITSNPDERPTAAISFPGKSPCVWRFNHHGRLEDLINKTPGLCVKPVCGMTVVGWDAAAVDVEVERLEEEDRLNMEKELAEERAEQERKEAQREATWERLMKPHGDFIAQQKPRSGPLTNDNLIGSYIAIWEGEEGKQWGDPYSNYGPYESRLDVFPGKSAHGVKASFYLGLIEGTMLLAMSRRSVELMREEQPKGRGEYVDEYDHEDTEDEEDGDKAPKVGEKRQLGSVADPWGVQAAMAKRQKTNPGLPVPKQEATKNRAYFQFVCNSVNAYPEVDRDNGHIGFFDFDATKLTANGEFCLPFYYGSKVQQLTLYKISDEPSADHRPKGWYMYDGRRWAGGWGGWGGW